MRPPWLLLVIVSLLAGLVVATAIAEQQVRPFAPLTSYSSQPDGARALALWLEEMGHEVVRLEAAPFEIDPSVEMVFALEPSVLYEPSHLNLIEEWVREGGTLVVAGNDLPTQQVLGRFDLQLQPTAPLVDVAVSAQPVFLDLPIERVSVRAVDTLRTERPAAVPLLAGDSGELVAVLMEMGSGRVVALASPHLFTNAGLAQSDNAAFILNVLAMAPGQGSVAFDEYHHGFVQRSADTTLSLALDLPAGWVVLYTGLIVLGFLALGGRRFGRAVSPPQGRRRGAHEFVRSMADLYRRAGQQSFVARHYAQHFRRRLATELGIGPGLPNDVVAEQLKGTRLGSTDILSTIQELDAAGPFSERRLLRLVQAAEDQMAVRR